MNRTADSHATPTPGGAQSFALRPPSVGWERIALPESADEFVWAWFKPNHLPDGLIFKVPPEAWLAPHHRSPLTLRRLLQSINLTPAAVVSGFVYGAAFDSQAGASPYFDQPLPPPHPTIEADVALFISTVVAPASTTTADDRSVPRTGQPDTAWLFETMESDWNASIKMERQMLLVRKQLSAMMNRLNTLNRDLSPDERMHGDRQDKSDMAQAQREFEAYRKRCQALLNSMTMALADATQEGERRATTILNRLAAKVRTGMTKKPKNIRKGF